MTTILYLVISLALAMLLHELGHLAAARICRIPSSEVGLGLGPRVWGLRVGGVWFNLRALPLGSFVRLDGEELRNKGLTQQLFVHLAGVMVNAVLAVAAYGTVFGWMNLLLAAANLLPLYQHDGWKCGVVLMRALLRRKSRPAEWAFTFSGGVASIILIDALIKLML